MNRVALISFTLLDTAMPSNAGNLRQTLLRLQQRDLSMREELAQDGSLYHGYHPRMEAVHRGNANELREIIKQFGWPNEQRVGRDGAEAAWLIAQHAISEPGFMRTCCELLDREVAAGRVPAWQFAYIYDRVRVSEGLPQRYGTQFEVTPDGPRLCSTEDPESVNARRLSVGLGTVAEHLARLQGGPYPTAEQYQARKAEEKAWRIKVGWIGADDA